MKSQFISQKSNLRNLEIKSNYEERIKKKMKDNKEKINNQIRRDMRPSKIIEKKINYEKKEIKIAKTLVGNSLMKDTKLNNNNNIRYINNNSTFIKKEINKKENRINGKEVNNKVNNTGKNLIMKRILTNQYQNNKNYNPNNNINNSVINQKYKTIYDMYRTNNIKNDTNNYMNNTIEIFDKPRFKRGDNINSSNNTFKCDMNIYLISSNHDNIIGNFQKIPINNKNIVSNSRIYSSPLKGLRILNLDEIKSYNNQINNNNKRSIYKNKNQTQKRSTRDINTIIRDNNNINNSSYIYKNAARNNSCFKRKKCYKKLSFEIKNENKVNNINVNPKIPITSFHKKNDKSFSNNHLLLPINEDFNRNINNQTHYLFQYNFNDSKSFVNKPNNENNVYNKIKARRIIKTSLVKRRFSNSFKPKDFNDLKNENDINKNNQTVTINTISRKAKVPNLKEYSNKNIFCPNESFNKIFNKTSMNLYHHSKRIFDDSMNIKNNNKDNNNNIKARMKYFYNHKKELGNYLKNKDNTIINKVKDTKLNKIPSLLNIDKAHNLNKLNESPKINKIYCKKNINDKKIELINCRKNKTFKKENSEISELNSVDNSDNNNNNNKETKEENNIANFDNDYLFDEKINETVNNYHCFQKKLYNYCLIKPIKRPYYINKIISKKNKHERRLISTSFNLPNISDIESRTLSLKNMSKEYPNFELSEMDEKKNSIENDKIMLEINNIEKIDKKTELSNYQKISLGAKKLKEIFEKKKELELAKKEKRTMTEENIYLGYSKLNDILYKKSNFLNFLNQNESTKEESNNNIIVNKKILTYKMPLKNKLELEEDNNKIIEENYYSVKDKEINPKIKFNNVNNKKSKRKSKSTEKRNINKLINKEIIKENEIDETIKDIILNDLKNYLNYLEKQKINKKEDISDGINDSYDWKIIDQLIIEKNIKLENIIKIYIDIYKNKDFINKDNIFKVNEYIKTIIEYYTIDLSKNQKEILRLKIKEIFNNIEDILNNNDENIFEILGNLLFILIKNKLYYIKDLNHFIGKEENIQINIAKIVKYAIISTGNLSKQYHNDFKYTKLFQNNDIFKNYITKEIYNEEEK